MMPQTSSRPGILSISSKLCLIPGSLLAMLSAAGAQTNGQWTGATVGTAPNANYSNTANWLGGIVADGAGATANFIYNPVSDGGTSGSALAGGFIFDTSHTLGNILLEDTAGFGGSTIGFNNPATVQTLTLATLDQTPPVVFGGQLLNSQLSGKKIVFNSGLAGTQGFLKTGPGYVSFRGPTAMNTITGTLAADGGTLSFRQQYNTTTTVEARNSATLELDFSGAGAGTTNRFPAGTTLVLGGAGGGASVLNTAAAAPTTHAQTFAGVTLAGGANEIRAIIGGTAPNFQDMTYNLGTVTPGAHTTLNFARSAATGTGNFLLSNSNDATGIVGSWLTFNSGDWAAATGGLSAAFTGYTADTWGTGLHTNVTGWRVLNSARTGTLRFNTGNAVKLQLNGTNTIETGGIISAQQAPVITGGTLTTGNADGALFLHAGGGGATGLLIESTIADGTTGPLRLTKSLFGVVTLAADNTFTGGTSIGAGTLILGETFGGGSTGSVAGNITLSALNAGGGAYNPNGVLAFNRAGAHTITNAINPAVYGGGYIEQWATGELIANRAMKVGGLRPFAGSVTLDFNAAGAPAADIVDGNFTVAGITVPTARLTIRNGNVNVKGKAGGASSQSFALTDALGVSKISVQPGAGGTATLNLGALNRTVNANDGGGILLLTTPAGGKITTTEGTAGRLLNPQWNIPYLVVNDADWAARSLTAGDIVAGSSVAGFHTPLSALTAGSNADFDTNTSLTADTNFASLRFNAAGTLTASSILQPGGILVTPAVGSGTVTIDGSAGVRAPAAGGTATATVARDFTVIQNAAGGKLVISAPVINADANNRTELSKAGPGELELSGANTYTGRTFVGGGVLRYSGSATVADTTTRAGSLFVRNGEVVLQESSAFYTGAFASVGQRVGEEGILTLKDNAVFDIAADFNIGDVNSKGTLNIGDAAVLNTRTFFIAKGGFSVGIINQTGGAINAANTPATEWNLGGNTAGDPLAQATYNLSGGSFSPGAQNFQIGRFGTGTLNMSGGTAGGGGYHVLGRYATGVGNLNLSGGTYDNSAGQVWFIVGELGRGNVKVSGDATLKVRNLSLGHNGGSGTVDQTGGLVETTDTGAPAAGLQAGITFGQAAAPALVLPDYSGSYHLGGGTLQTFGIGENTGATVPITSTFQFDGGTLKAVGDNPLFLEGLDNAVVQDGGAVIDTNAFAITINQALTHDRALGTTADGGLTKTGTGTLTLSAANTWTGDTRVSGGTLSLGQASLADSSALRLSTGGTVDLAFSGTDTIDRLFIDNTGMAAGTWGSLASTATNKSERFTGSGLLLVKTAGGVTPAGYDAWAALPANGLTAGVNDGKSQDPDMDSIPNLTEFVLDGNPSVSSTAILPTATLIGSNTAFSFKRRDDSEAGTTVVVEYSPDLENWNFIPIGAVSSGPVTITENGGSPDDVLVQVPFLPQVANQLARLYARLKITSIP
ncbi:MAG: autotransporter-associated beta strand repeat-containing protein [Verrucomicrobiota bacterium]